MDFRVFHFLNGLLAGHGHLQQVVVDFSTWSVPIFAAATAGLWLLARPYGSTRWKLAASSALASAGLGLLAGQVIGKLWFRERPFAAHPGSTLLLVHKSLDPSFPSDHATAAFAIAFAVLFFSIRAGLLFLLAASAIAFSRVLVGVHYPGDVLAGAAVGLLCAAAVATVGRPVLSWAVGLLSRLSDPALATVERRLARPRR